MTELESTRRRTSPGANIAQNTTILVALRVGMPLLSVALVLTISRVLGADGLGRYILATTFLYFFDTVAPLGLRAVITREAARDRNGVESLLANALTLGTFSSLPLAALMAGLGAWLGYDPPTRNALAVLSLALPASTLAAYFESTLIAYERMEYVACSSIADSAIKVGAGVTLLLCGFGLEAVLLAFVAGRVAACLVSAALLRRVGVRVRWALEPAIFRSILREAPTFLLISVFATLYWRIDTFMLSKMRPVADVGYYGAAWRLLEFSLIVPQSFCLALYPQLSVAAGRDPGALAWLGRAASRYLLAMSIPAAVAITLLAGPLLTLLYGEPFRAAADILVILMWTIVPYGWVRYHAYVLVAANRQRVDLAFNAVMSVLNVLLNLALIPHYGPVGAGLATLISICFYAAAQYVYVQRRLPGHAAPLKPDPVPLLAAVLMGVCLWLARDHGVLLAIALAPVVYGTTLLLAGFFTSDELRAVGLERLTAQLGLLFRSR